MSGKDYIVDDGFKDTVSSRIRIAEIEQRATLAYREGHYEEAIEYIDEFLTQNPRESKAHILRGLCNEARDDYNSAIRDYKSAFINGLPDDVRELLNRRLVFLSNPITILDRSKYLKLLVDDMPTESERGEQIDNAYFRGFRNIFDGNRKLQEEILKSVDPELESWRSVIIKRRNTIRKTGYNVELLGFDEDGYFLVSDEELIRRKAKHPNRPYIVVASARDNETGEERFYKFNVKKSFRMSLDSESVFKDRLRKMRYYERHKDERKDHQLKYDQDNRIRKHFRNKIDYLLRRQGISRVYSDATWREKPTEDSAYQELSSHEEKDEE